MQAVYRRDLNETWMILPEESAAAEYECRMLTEIPHTRLLRLKKSTAGTGKEYAFAISRGMSLEEILKRDMLDFDGIRLLFSGLSEALAEADEYLLDRDHLVMDAACIYGFPDLAHLRFCCHPGYQADFFEGIKHLIEYLLERVDHRDRRAAETLYECCRVCDWPNYRFEDLLAAIGERLGDADPERYFAENKTVPDAEEAPENSESRSAGKIPRLISGCKTLRERKADEGFRRPSVLTRIIPWAVMLFLLAAALWQYYALGYSDWRLLVLALAAVVCGIVLAISRRIQSRREQGPPESWDEYDDKKAENDNGFNECSAASEDKTEWIAAGDDPLSAATVWMGTAEDVGTDTWILSPREKNMGEILLTHFPFVIGKMKGEVDACLEKPVISRIHARFEKEGEHLWLIDCRSTNGTRKNGIKLIPEQREEIREGDEVMFADLIFEVVHRGQDAPTGSLNR